MRHGIIIAAAFVAMNAAAGLALAQAADAPAQIIITNVNVWDGTSDTVAQGVDVLVEGNKIKNVAKGIKASGATVIDGQGGTVTPGLIDMHQHLILNGGTAAGNNWDAYVQGAHASRAAEYLLRSGFTTIRDIAGNTIGLKRAINQGILPGPRVYTSGPAIGPTGGHSDWGSRVAAPGEQNYQQKVQNTHVVDGRAEWLRAGRWNLRNGADFLKVMAGGGVASEFDPLHLQSPSPEEMAAAVQAAKEYGTYVAIHAYTDDAYLKSLKAGVKSFEQIHQAAGGGRRMVVVPALWRLQASLRRLSRLVHRGHEGQGQDGLRGRQEHHQADEAIRSQNVQRLRHVRLGQLAQRAGERRVADGGPAG
jgi:imidazolonepropionase-like amidohydrolase